MGHMHQGHTARASRYRHRPGNRREMRLAQPMAALRRRWGPSVAIILIALIVLICAPQSFLYVLAAVVIAFIALSILRRHSCGRPTYRG